MNLWFDVRKLAQDWEDGVYLGRRKRAGQGLSSYRVLGSLLRGRIALMRDNSVAAGGFAHLPGGNLRALREPVQQDGAGSALPGHIGSAAMRPAAAWARRYRMGAS